VRAEQKVCSFLHTVVQVVVLAATIRQLIAGVG
jgi:hypothetical protein